MSELVKKALRLLMANKHKRKQKQQQDEDRNHRSKSSENATTSSSEQTLRRSDRASTQASSKAEPYRAHVAHHSQERKDDVNQIPHRAQSSSSSSSSSSSVVSSDSIPIRRSSNRSFRPQWVRQICMERPGAINPSSTKLYLHITYPYSGESQRGWSRSDAHAMQNKSVLAKLLCECHLTPPQQATASAAVMNACGLNDGQTDEKKASVDNDMMHDVSSSMHGSVVNDARGPVPQSAGAASASSGQLAAWKQWCNAFKDCHVTKLFVSNDERKLFHVDVVVTCVSPSNAEHLMHAVNTLPPSSVIQCKANYALSSLIAGYAVGLPVQLIGPDLPGNSVAQHRRDVFGSSSVRAIHWKEDVMSDEWFATGRVQFAIDSDPHALQQLLTFKDLVKSSIGESYAARIRFYMYQNAADHCCSYCWQKGHTRADHMVRLGKARDSKEPSACVVCHTFHPDIAEAHCQRKQASCTLCGASDHIVPRCKLYKAREVEMTDQYIQQRLARQNRKEQRLNDMIPSFDNRSSALSVSAGSSMSVRSGPASSSGLVSSSSPSVPRTYSSVLQSHSSLSGSNLLPHNSNHGSSLDSANTYNQKQQEQQMMQLMQMMEQMRKENQQNTDRLLQTITTMQQQIQSLTIRLADATERASKLEEENRALKRKAEQQLRAARQTKAAKQSNDAGTNLSAAATGQLVQQTEQHDIVQMNNVASESLVPALSAPMSSNLANNYAAGAQ